MKPRKLKEATTVGAGGRVIRLLLVLTVGASCCAGEKTSNITTTELITVKSSPTMVNQQQQQQQQHKQQQQQTQMQMQMQSKLKELAASAEMQAAKMAAESTTTTTTTAAAKSAQQQQQQQVRLLEKQAAQAKSLAEKNSLPPAAPTTQPQLPVAPPTKSMVSSSVTPTTSSQLDKPTGYSYESPSASASISKGAYTHTSPLSPARQEILWAEQVSAKQRNRQQQQQLQQQQQQQFAYNSDRWPHSSSVFETLPRTATPSGVQYSKQQQAMNGKQSIIKQQQQQTFQHVQQVAEFRGSSPSRVAPAVGANFAMMPAPHLSITGTPSNPCKAPLPAMLAAGGLQDVSQNSIQVMGLNHELGGLPPSALPNFSSATPKYQRVGVGTHLRSQYIFKVIRADSLTDCEEACTRASSLAGNNLADTCRSFNYRAYFAAENCELSRHDIRSLKLEDSSQFEQHTQFDFYGLESPPTVAPSSGALMMSGSSGALVYSAFPETDCLDVSQSCSQDGMEFTLRTNEPFNGRIYTYGFYDSCFTDGEGSSTSVLRISRSNGFPRCGTQQIGDLMTNIVVVQFNDYVQTTRDKKYNLTCYFSGPGEAVVTSNYLDTKLDERSHPIQIEHLPPQNVITSNVHLRVLYRGQPTNTIAVGDLLTFRLETRGTTGSGGGGSALHQSHRAGNLQAPPDGATIGTQHEIFATNVIAKDPYSGRQVALIDSRGCPIDPVNVFPELQRTPDGALESEFYAFKIPDSNFLIFQATVRTCKAPCEPAICQHPSSVSGQQHNVGSGIKGGSMHSGYLVQQSASVPSWGKRRRRFALPLDGAEQLDEDELLSLGETVEHVVPVRNSAILADTRQVQTIRRPELTEAEEEVKEMFRVYMSRAEMNSSNNNQSKDNKQHLRRPQANRNQSEQYSEVLPTKEEEKQPIAILQSSQLISSDTLAPSTSTLRSTNALGEDELNELQVCMNQSSYYVMLFSVIGLSMIMLSVMSVSLYITRRAKVHISDSIASSMF